MVSCAKSSSFGSISNRGGTGNRNYIQQGNSHLAHKSLKGNSIPKGKMSQSLRIPYLAQTWGSGTILLWGREGFFPQKGDKETNGLNCNLAAIQTLKVTLVGSWRDGYATEPLYTRLLSSIRDPNKIAYRQTATLALDPTTTKEWWPTWQPNSILDD